MAEDPGSGQLEFEFEFEGDDILLRQKVEGNDASPSTVVAYRSGTVRV